MKKRALNDLDLLDQVVEFKMRFWCSNAVRYDLCKPGTLRPVPPNEQMKLVEEDYERIRNMLFGEIPEISEVMELAAALEKEINAL